MGRWRPYGYIRVVLGALALLLCVLFVGNAAPSAAVTPPAFDKARAWEDLTRQVAFGPRVPGTPEHVKARDWLKAQLERSCAEVTLQPFTHPLGGRQVPMWNIIGRIPGKGPEPRELVLLMAHWDTRPTADHDPDPAKRGRPIDGANDGASGVAVLLEIARQLHARPIARDVMILLTDGEDYGPQVDNMLLGAKYFAANQPKRKPDWGILLDMIGDKDLAIYREPYSDFYARAINDRVFRAARELGYIKEGDKPGFVDAPNKYGIIDDHIPLNEAGVPVVDLIDFEYPPWHTSADTIDKCSPDSLEIVGKTVLRVLHVE